MADNRYSTIQLLEDSESDEDDAGGRLKQKADNLTFQEFPTLPSTSGSTYFTLGGAAIPEAATFPTGNLTNAGGKESSDDDGDKGELLAGEKKSPPFWTFEYYQTFFDVDTSQVLSRLAHSVMPSRQNFILTRIRPNPDLYGPFWVCTTLIFTIAIFGNLSSYFEHRGRGDWKYDFHVVSVSGCVIYAYASVVPSAVWGFLMWRGNQLGFSFLEVICLYGYSMSIFIPISILWVVEFSWLRWLFVGLAVVISGSVLVLTLWTAVEDDSRKAAISLMMFVVTMHVALAVGFRLYFFKNNQITEYLPMTMHPTWTRLSPTNTTTTVSYGAISTNTRSV